MLCFTASPAARRRVDARTLGSFATLMIRSGHERQERVDDGGNLLLVGLLLGLCAMALDLVGDPVFTAAEGIHFECVSNM